MIYLLDVNERIINVLSNDNPGACPYYKDKWRERLNDALITYDFSAPMDHETAKLLKEDGYIMRESPAGVLTLLQIVETGETVSNGSLVTEVYAENCGLELLGNVVNPADYTGRTVAESANIALTGTRWKLGRVDWLGNVNLKVDDFETSLAVIQQVAADVGAEIEFRVEVNPDNSISRFVDFLERRGVDTGKRYEHGKDLVEVKRIANRATVATAIIPVGKGGEDAERLTIENIEWKVANGDPVDKPLGQNWIGDEAARMRWGNGGLHIRKVLNTELEDPARLIKAGWDELQIKKEASVTYEMKVIHFRDRAGYEDEQIHIGDGIQAFDPSFYPELMLYARIQEYEISFTDPAESEVVFGNYRLLKTNINAAIREIQSKLIRNEVVWTQGGTKITTGPDMPTNPVIDDFWMDTSNAALNVLRRFDGFGWVPATPTEANQISESTGRKWAAESGANVTENNIAADTFKLAGTASSVVRENAEKGVAAKTKLDVEVGTAVIETTAGAATKAGAAQQNAITYTVNNAERKVFIQTTQPTGVIENGYKWIDTSNPGVDVWKVMKGGQWVEIGRSDLSQLSGQIESAQIKTGAVLSDKLDGLAVTMEKLAANSVTTAKMVDRAMTGAKVALDAITNDLMAPGSITVTEVVDRTLTGAKIALDAVTNDLMALNSIGTNEIQSRALTSGKIALDAVTNDLIADNAVNTEQIVARAMTGAKIALDAITNDLVADSAIQTENVVNRTLTGAKIALLAVSGAEMANTTVAAGKMVANTITAGQIAGLTITAAEIAGTTITAAKIVGNTITATQIASRTITADRIVTNSLTALEIAASAITAEKIVAGAVTASKISATSPNLLYDVDSFTQYLGKEPPGSSGLSTNIVVDDFSYNGRFSLKHTSSGVNSFKYINPISNGSGGWARMKNGSRYILSAYVMTTSAAPVNVQLVSVPREYNSTVGSGSALSASVSISAADGWVRLKALVPVISGINPALAYYIRHGGAGYDSYWSAFQLEEQIGADSEPSPYSPGGSVTLDGGNVLARTILANSILANSLTANEIASNAIATDELAANSVIAEKIVGRTISADKIVSLSLTANEIAATTITAAKIVGNTITATQIAGTTITANELASNSVTAIKIVGRTVTADKITSLSLTANEIAATTITAAKIVGNTITATQIAATTITANEISAGAINVDKLAANSVTAAKILAGQITTQHVTTGGLSAEVIKFGVMDGERISVTFLSALSTNMGTVTAGTIDGVLYRSGTGTDKTLRMESGFISMVDRVLSGNLYLYTDTLIANGAVTLEYSSGVGAPEYTAMLSPDDLRMSSLMGMSILQADLFEMRTGGTIDNPANHYSVSMTTTATTVYSKDPLTLQGNNQKLVLSDTTLRFNGSPIGFSGSEILWSGGTLLIANESVYPTRTLSNCPNGWILVWSRYVNGAASGSDYNFTFIPKMYATIGGGSWHALPATGSSALTTAPPVSYKYVYAADNRIYGHARNEGGTEGGQCLRYVLAF